MPDAGPKDTSCQGSPSLRFPEAYNPRLAVAAWDYTGVKGGRDIVPAQALAHLDSKALPALGS